MIEYFDHYFKMYERDAHTLGICNFYPYDIDKKVKSLFALFYSDSKETLLINILFFINIEIKL